MQFPPIDLVFVFKVHHRRKNFTRGLLPDLTGCRLNICLIPGSDSHPAPFSSQR
jgi:hypothetical protein